MSRSKARFEQPSDSWRHDRRSTYVYNEQYTKRGGIQAWAATSAAVFVEQLDGFQGRRSVVLLTAFILAL